MYAGQRDGGAVARVMRTHDFALTRAGGHLVARSPRGGSVTITQADGSRKAYRFRVESQILTLDPDEGARLIFRKSP